MQKGKFVPNGRKGRTMVLVDIRETLSAKAADIFLQVRPSKDFEAITALRAIVKGQRVDPALVEETGLKLEQLQDLADRMKRCKFGVIFFGMGLSMTRGKHMNLASVLTLAAEMNAFTRDVRRDAHARTRATSPRPTTRYAEPAGYPFRARPVPASRDLNPGEFSTVYDMLVRGDIDAAFVLGADPGATMPQPGI